MAYWFSENFETATPTEDIDGYNLWRRAGDENVESGTIIASNDALDIIDGSISARLTATQNTIGVRYDRVIAPHNNYTMSWKWKFRSISSSSDNNAPGPTAYFALRAGMSLDGVAWGITIQPKFNRIKVQHGAPDSAIIMTKEINWTDFTSTHTMLVETTPDHTMTVSIDGSPKLEVYARRVDSGVFYVIGNAGFAESAYVNFDTLDFQYTPTTVPSAPKAPTNVQANKRANYTVVSWDRVTALEDETPLADVTRYEVYGSDQMNEYTQELRQTITTTDPAGKIDTACVDVTQGNTQVYRVKAIVVDGPDVVESELSDRAVAIYTPSQIDDKTEVIDGRLFTLDESLLDEDLLV